MPLLFNMVEQEIRLTQQLPLEKSSSEVRCNNMKYLRHKRRNLSDSPQVPRHRKRRGSISKRKATYRHHYRAAHLIFMAIHSDRRRCKQPAAGVRREEETQIPTDGEQLHQTLRCGGMMMAAAAAAMTGEQQQQIPGRGGLAAALVAATNGAQARRILCREGKLAALAQADGVKAQVQLQPTPGGVMLAKIHGMLLTIRQDGAPRAQSTVGGKTRR